VYGSVNMILEPASISNCGNGFVANVGGVVSWIIAFCVVVVCRPDVSVAVQVIVFIPMGYPAGGMS